MKKNITYPCPYCKKMTIFSDENPFRPFCSERCKQIDLGAWANEEYKIAITAANEETAAGGEEEDE